MSIFECADCGERNEWAENKYVAMRDEFIARAERAESQLADALAERNMCGCQAMDQIVIECEYHSERSVRLAKAEANLGRIPCPLCAESPDLSCINCSGKGYFDFSDIKRMDERNLDLSNQCTILRAERDVARAEIERLRARSLAPKYHGMKVSLLGLAKNTKNYMVEELYKNAKEMADHFYSGDFSVVDEFCQLYCLDEKREWANE